MRYDRANLLVVESAYDAADDAIRPCKFAIVKEILQFCHTSDCCCKFALSLTICSVIVDTHFYYCLLSCRIKPL
jgi:hypothetical protein